MKTALFKDGRGRSAIGVTIVAALFALPLLHPAKTMSLLKDAQHSWERVWTIPGI